MSYFGCVQFLKTISWVSFNDKLVLFTKILLIIVASRLNSFKQKHNAKRWHSNYVATQSQSLNHLLFATL